MSALSVRCRYKMDLAYVQMVFGRAGLGNALGAQEMQPATQVSWTRESGAAVAAHLVLLLVQPRGFALQTTEVEYCHLVPR
jgi:hypothetical protein